MTVPSVRLLFFLADDTVEVWEEDVAAWIADHPDSKPDLLDINATLHATGDGQEGRVTDQLVSLLEALCFDAVIKLLETGESIFNLYSAPTTVRLRIVGENVELASNVVDPVAFPKAAFLEGLLACGERCVALIERVWGDNPDNTAVFEALKAQAQEARTKLGG